MMGMSSCFKNFYNTRSTAKVTDKEIQLLEAPGKKVVIHYGGLSFDAGQVQVRDGMLTAKLQPQDILPNNFKGPNYEAGPHTFKIKYKEELLANIHLFTNQPIQRSDTSISLPLTNIKEMQTYTYNTGRSIASHALGVGTIAAGVFALYAVAAVVLFDAIIVSLL
jgi:hypothetical protein